MIELINNVVSFYSCATNQSMCFAWCLLGPQAGAAEQVESPLPPRKKTPVGRGILKAYFATVPPLPLLIWVNLHVGGQVFQFPPELSITEVNVLSWLERLKAGLEIPSSKWPWVCSVPKHTLLALLCL